MKARTLELALAFCLAFLATAAGFAALHPCSLHATTMAEESCR